MNNSGVKKRFARIDYLRYGNERQRAAWGVPGSGGVFATPGRYKPVLAGTIPLGIDVAGSDLDVICRSGDRENKELLIGDMVSALGREKFFSLSHIMVETLHFNAATSVSINFHFSGGFYVSHRRPPPLYGGDAGCRATRKEEFIP